MKPSRARFWPRSRRTSDTWRGLRHAAIAGGPQAGMAAVIRPAPAVASDEGEATPPVRGGTGDRRRRLGLLQSPGPLRLVLLRVYHVQCPPAVRHRFADSFRRRGAKGGQNPRRAV